MDYNSQLHTDVERFSIRDNQLCVGQYTLTELAQRAGSTPYYVYSSQHIRQRIEKLRNELPVDISVHYAMKANPMIEVVKFISPLVDGLDVASKGELNVALAAGCDPSCISFAGPGKTDDELRCAITAGVTINVESERELARINQISEGLDRIANVALRVNPSFELKSSGMKMSGGPKPFGIDEERIPAVLASLTGLKAQFVGFHIFTGSQNLKSEAICEAQTRSLDLALKLLEYAPNPPKWINIGGGFGVPYFSGDKPLALQSIGRNLENLTAKLKSVLPDCELIIELGRYIVAEAGLYVCKVVDIKESRGHCYLITNGGLHHHLAASGNFGQVIRKNYPVIVGTNVDPATRNLCSVVGPLCTPLDMLADKVVLAAADIDDLIAIFQSGAYGYTASPHLFLGHPPPIELFI